MPLHPHLTSHSPSPTILRGNTPRKHKPPSPTQQNTHPSLQLHPQHPIPTPILQSRTTLSQPEVTIWIPDRNRRRPIQTLPLSPSVSNEEQFSTAHLA